MSAPNSDGSDAGERLAAAFPATPLSPRVAFARLRDLEIRGVQLDATRPGLRPRELDRSARRDLSATLARHGLTVAGLDLWIPPAHFAEPGRVDRAVASVDAALDLAADLGRPPVSVVLPPAGDATESVTLTLAGMAERRGVTLADHAVRVDADPGPPPAGVGIDPPAWLAQGADPIAAVTRWGEKCGVARLCDLLSTGGRGPLGHADGQLDLLAYRVALETSSFAGPFVIDPRGWTNPWADLPACRRAWLAGAPGAAG
ncbi:MAG: hypothetical protein HKO59_02370 [Phycisphaerales bacterium]|nr:hypothetical protein [Phycisphaerae bacterium]NNF42007.1 hypothetical protein [Phycisphaerales bacterium]NNM24827.1 hypothetical protein [Phycisphaerales bacterium]